MRTCSFIAALLIATCACSTPGDRGVDPDPYEKPRAGSTSNNLPTAPSRPAKPSSAPVQVKNHGPVKSVSCSAPPRIRYPQGSQKEVCQAVAYKVAMCEVYSRIPVVKPEDSCKITDQHSALRLVLEKECNEKRLSPDKLRAMNTCVEPIRRPKLCIETMPCLGLKYVPGEWEIERLRQEAGQRKP